MIIIAKKMQYNIFIKHFLYRCFLNARIVLSKSKYISKDIGKHGGTLVCHLLQDLKVPRFKAR